METLNNIKNGDATDFRIMKITRSKIEGLTVDWKELWERIIR